MVFIFSKYRPMPHLFEHHRAPFCRTSSVVAMCPPDAPHKESFLHSPTSFYHASTCHHRGHFKAASLHFSIGPRPCATYVYPHSIFGRTPQLALIVKNASTCLHYAIFYRKEEESMSGPQPVAMCLICRDFIKWKEKASIVPHQIATCSNCFHG